MAIALMSDAHAEWHRNANVPMGLSCPWDACDPANLTDEEYDRLIAQQEANAKAEEEFLASEEAAALCEHGMSAWLCAGPSHYPMDDGSDW